MTDQPIDYKGRKAKYSRGEVRRQQILEAALRIVVSEGVRSVRHRAVAKEADVPLSATTYYFKDIKDLILDTFTLFVDRALQNVADSFDPEVEAFIRAIDQEKFKDTEFRREFTRNVAEMFTAYIIKEITDKGILVLHPM